ncbi:MAG: hypothetical protein AB1705_20640 [Verrucomicrobiota bacterium]
MTAEEVIEQIKALPPEGKAAVVGFIHEMEREGEPSAEIRYMDNKTFREAKERVFAKHSELLSRLAK